MTEKINMRRTSYAGEASCRSSLPTSGELFVCWCVDLVVIRIAWSLFGSMVSLPHCHVCAPHRVAPFGHCMPNRPIVGIAGFYIFQNALCGFDFKTNEKTKHSCPSMCPHTSIGLLCHCARHFFYDLIGTSFQWLYFIRPTKTMRLQNEIIF